MAKFILFVETVMQTNIEIGLCKCLGINISSQGKKGLVPTGLFSDPAVAC